MKAAILTAFDQPLAIENVPDPSCPPDGVIVEIKACGVCRSDWHGWKGAHPKVKPPHIPGHEFAGVIVEVGADVTKFQKGQRVTAPFILACGHCPDCQKGQATICTNQHVVGFGNPGAFAEMLAVPRADFNLVALPEELGFVETAGMGCRVTTAFRALVDRAHLQPEEWLAIHGCGGVGLSALIIAKALGARVVAVDVNPEALDFAKTLGADLTLNAAEIDDLPTAIRDQTSGGANVSIDGLGITQTFTNSIACLDRLGRHIQIGMPTEKHAHVDLPLLDLVYMRQISLMGTRGMAASGFSALFELIRDKDLQPARLISNTIALDQASAVLKEMDDNLGVGIKVIDRF